MHVSPKILFNKCLMKHLKKHLQTLYNIHSLFPFMNYAVAVCPEKTRNIPFLTSFREGENVTLHYFYSIKNLNKNIFKN